MKSKEMWFIPSTMPTIGKCEKLCQPSCQPHLFIGRTLRERVRLIT